MSTTNARVADALETVRDLIFEIVRHEQLRDGLTSLPNDSALTEKINSLLQSDSSFWIAFVEIDHFKRLNDQFGYQNADGMLVKVAQHLRMAQDYFSHHVDAFRAHGDEYYLVGTSCDEEDCAEIDRALNTVRETISRVRLVVKDAAENMSCSVSVGWLRNSDLDGAVATDRRIRLMLEAAVAQAKREGRNRVIRYTDDSLKASVSTVRDSCSNCEVAFTVDLRVDAWGTEDLHCPSCGHRSSRPRRPQQAPEPQRV